jgi:hypothetical protein
MLIDWNAIGSVSTALALVVGVGDKNGVRHDKNIIY